MDGTNGCHDRILNVSKAYAPVGAIHSVDLRVPGGGTTLLIGPRGCGKSSLLRLTWGAQRSRA
jgi:ABC-type sugar transport system ATPase subunit